MHKAGRGDRAQVIEVLRLGVQANGWGDWRTLKTSDGHGYAPFERMGPKPPLNELKIEIQTWLKYTARVKSDATYMDALSSFESYYRDKEETPPVYYTHEYLTISLPRSARGKRLKIDNALSPDKSKLRDTERELIEIWYNSL